MKVFPSLARLGQGITLTAIVGLVSFSTLIQLNSKKAGQLRLFQEGIQTCFSRVAQTFTARTIGDINSVYVGSEFKAFTEECFGEVMVAFETIQTSKASEILGTTNKINQEVFELHKKIHGNQLETPENVMLANIGSRFESLEVKRDQVLGLVDESLQQLNGQRNTLKFFFYFFCVVTPILILLNLLKNVSTEKLFRRLEKEASDLLADETFQTTKSEALISNALKEQNLLEVRKLFEAYRTRKSDTVVADTVGKSTFLNPNKDVESQVMEIWDEEVNKGEKKISVTTSNIETSVNSVIDSLTDKLFINGIKVNADLRKSLIQMEREDLDQVIYYAITGLMNNADKKAEDRTLRVRSSNHGNRIRLDIVFTGSKLDDSVIRQLQESGTVSNVVELSICQQLMKDGNGKISLANRKGPEGTMTVITLEFQRAPQGKLVDVKKITKRDWHNRRQVR
jgi:hypothetical protein